MCMQSFGTTSQAPQSVFCPVQRRNVSEICTLSFLAAYRGWVGDWPRPSSPGGSTLPSSALLAPSNSQLLSSQSCPWSHGGCLHQEVMHTYPTSHQRLMTDKGQKVILPSHKINFAVQFMSQRSWWDHTEAIQAISFIYFLLSPILIFLLFSSWAHFLIHCLLKNPHLRLCFLEIQTKTMTAIGNSLPSCQTLLLRHAQVKIPKDGISILTLDGSTGNFYKS